MITKEDLEIKCNDPSVTENHGKCVTTHIVEYKWAHMFRKAEYKSLLSLHKKTLFLRILSLEVIFVLTDVFVL